jgi:hypothetical protein
MSSNVTPASSAVRVGAMLSQCLCFSSLNACVRLLVRNPGMHQRMHSDALPRPSHIRHIEPELIEDFFHFTLRLRIVAADKISTA